MTGPEDLVEWDRQVRHWFDYIFGTPVSDVFFAGVSSLAFCEDGSLVAEARVGCRHPDADPGGGSRRQGQRGPHCQARGRLPGQHRRAGPGAAVSGWKLPTSVTVCGQEFAIRSDYRAVLDAISALRDPELSPQEQTLACLEILYPDWKRLPDLSAAAQAAMVFINCGKPVEAAVPKPALVDWDTDAAIMAPAVDKVLATAAAAAPTCTGGSSSGHLAASGTASLRRSSPSAISACTAKSWTKPSRNLCATIPIWSPCPNTS